jgi:hypothetical protein
MKNILAVLLLFVVSVALLGCNESPLEGKGRLTLYMTDGPTAFEAVNVVIARVEVHTSGGGWMTVNNTERTFDLLSLRNGAVTVLGDAELNAGHYTQIRLILGAGSTVTVDGQTFELSVPSNEIKLIHQFEIQVGTQYELLLDFDAARSVVFSAGAYQLKPTIRVRAVAQTGAVVGEILTMQTTALVTATSTGDTAATYTAVNGSFKIMGLTPGSYSLRIQRTGNSNAETTITGIEVSTGRTTNVGVVTLSP